MVGWLPVAYFCFSSPQFCLSCPPHQHRAEWLLRGVQITRSATCVHQFLLQIDLSNPRRTRSSDVSWVFGGRIDSKSWRGEGAGLAEEPRALSVTRARAPQKETSVRATVRCRHNITPPPLHPPLRLGPQQEDFQSRIARRWRGLISWRAELSEKRVCRWVLE